MKITKRHVIQYFLGISLAAIGITIMIQTNIGSAAWDALFVHFSQVTNLSVGQARLIIELSLIPIILLIKFQYKVLLSIFASLIISISVDIFTLIVVNLNILLFFEKHYLLLWLLWFIGLNGVAAGVAFIVKSMLFAVPVDALMIAIMSRFNIASITLAKTIVESIAFLFALLLFVMGNLEHGDLGFGAIGIGTIASFVLIGPLIGLYTKLITRQNHN
ncbi:hypothetical protein JIN86_21750 [Lysinibacillus sp. HST-98]|uniref:hypothetical protein n=1 Tax=Lysinibacillus sp. HST-98 TaxID=2800419 RepID=UPI0019286DF1|nr:hypothetical protein [Lysinibacillus sp. HST-98]MBL3732188.1 hypothetical protein [Lysinibacillus sp. HST-98]